MSIRNDQCIVDLKTIFNIINMIPENPLSSIPTPDKAACRCNPLLPHTLTGAKLCKQPLLSLNLIVFNINFA